MIISACIPVRNDNYGNNLEDRATFCLNSMINTYDFVYLIDWNSDVLTKGLYYGKSKID